MYRSTRIPTLLKSAKLQTSLRSKSVNECVYSFVYSNASHIVHSYFWEFDPIIASFESSRHKGHGKGQKRSTNECTDDEWSNGTNNASCILHVNPNTLSLSFSTPIPLAAKHPLAKPSLFLHFPSFHPQE